jgi:putative Ca2+/H+ antiporter (TMEM165/GDT1 family)
MKGLKNIYILIILSLICVLNFANCQEVVSKNEIPSATTIQKEPTKNFWDSFLAGFGLIFISEIGDKTFFLTMIYAASNSFLKTLTVTSMTMLTMNFISLLIGYALPFLVYREYIDWIGIIVFAFFGVKLIYDAAFMESKLIDSEFEEVKESIRKGSMSSRASSRRPDIENKDLKEKLLHKEESFDTMPVLAYVSSLVIAELGDRSQITAIVIGAINNFYGVLIGTSIAFVGCIITAILFGNFLKSRLTTRELTFIGGITFLLFSFIYMLEKFHYI